METKFPDQVITDSFRIVRKLRAKEDEEGNCYDWYEIDHHYRVQDKFTPQIDKIEEAIKAVTPYTETQTAYIGDTEKVFYTDRTGNLTVFFPGKYSVERLSDRIIISFDELEEVAEITITIL